QTRRRARERARRDRIAGGRLAQPEAPQGRGEPIQGRAAERPEHAGPGEDAELRSELQTFADRGRRTLPACQQRASTTSCPALAAAKAQDTHLAETAERKAAPPCSRTLGGVFHDHGADRRRARPHRLPVDGKAEQW